MDDRGSATVLRVLLIVGVTLIAFTSFTGFFFAEQTTMNKPEGSSRTPITADASYSGDSYSWMPSKTQFFYIGEENRKFSFLPQEKKNDNWALSVTEYSGDQSFGYYYSSEDGNVIEESLLLMRLNDGTKLYVFITDLTSRKNTEGTIKCDVYDPDFSGELVGTEPRSVGEFDAIATLNDPPVEVQARYSFTDVVTGMFSFDIPKVPSWISAVITGTIYLMLGYVLFIVVTKITPFIG